MWPANSNTSDFGAKETREKDENRYSWSNGRRNPFADPANFEQAL